MPNWCECDLYISGPREELEKFLETVKSEESRFDFDRIIPYPEHFRERDRVFQEWMTKPPEEKTGQLPPDGYNEDSGFEWHILNWGTKWNARRASLCEQIEAWDEDEREMLSVELNFDTAWSPPKPIIERASERFPELLFDLRYFEGGMQFNGILICAGGEVTRDETGPYFGTRGG
jgi:hypothetical protein